MSGRVLDGIRILDLTRVVAGPFATAVLADLGAEVIKIERPGLGDDYRFGPSPPGETSLSFQNTNRGKKSITLDVRKDAGRELFLKLVETADAVVENFRAGWMVKQGLGPDVIQARNPRCVVASLSGFGATGERAGEPSYDIVAQATGGLMAMTGHPDGPPLRGGGALGDYVGGLYLGLGIVAGILERDRTGEARVLDLSNQDAIFAITDSAATIYEGIGARTERLGNEHPFACPYGAFETTDGWVAIATASNRLYRKLCEAIGRPELGQDERFKDHRKRAENRPVIHGVLAEWVGARDTQMVVATLGPGGADLPCARVSSPEELIGDPQLLARGMLERVEHPTLGEVVFHGNPLKFSGAEGRARGLAPELGADNAEVFGEVGVSGAELAALSEDRTV